MRDQKNLLSRAEIFNRLRELGATTATVSFQGGGDEGGVEAIILADSAGIELPLALEENYSGSRYNPATQKWEPTEPNTPNQDLAAALGAPVYEQYGSFAGEFYVNGTVEYNVVAGTVKMGKSERVESYEHSEEDL
jgi:hypothetical protein